MVAQGLYRPFHSSVNESSQISKARGIALIGVSVRSANSLAFLEDYKTFDVPQYPLAAHLIQASLSISPY
jgi:hypothetical protein